MDMNSVIEKYHTLGLDTDACQKDVISAFCAAVSGNVYDGALFKMHDDERVRSVLDDEDFARWCEIKAAYAGR